MLELGECICDWHGHKSLLKVLAVSFPVIAPPKDFEKSASPNPQCDPSFKRCSADIFICEEKSTCRQTNWFQPIPAITAGAVS
ncbi:MAG: hypothetical protein CM15mP12_5020 [Gammaproteobacteria bacterium]|nr:MAG: hypothetical protein CM15mP12_5020 [Gammaproteobacteria bacterium]